MSIALSFGNYANYQITESRLSDMIHSDRKSAIQMNWWDKIKDFFRFDKQSQALHELYNVIHGSEGKDKLDAFNIMSSLARPEYQHQFTKKLNGDEMQFCVGQQVISSCPAQHLMNIDAAIPLLPMSAQEEELFVNMLDTLREIELIHPDLCSSEIRREMSHQFCDAVSDYYRPSENIYSLGAEWNPETPLSLAEQTQLKCINSGSFNIFSQFNKMGYQQTDGGVEFCMMHPAITYLLGTYNRIDAMGMMAISNSDLIMANSCFMQVFNQDFADYQDNKSAIDDLLKRVYDWHDGTLDISLTAQNRNKLVVPAPLYGQSVISTEL